MRPSRRVALNRIILGPLVAPWLATWAGCGGGTPTGGRAPSAGLDELEAQGRFNQERQKKEQEQASRKP